MQESPRRRRLPLEAGQRLLLAALLALLAAVWLEPAGSWLAEPDEARYAEIPREMLAAQDLVTPRLNGVPYFEKPPLLYWLNAASLRLFGETPWAARLPTRLAGLGTVLLLIFGLAGPWGMETGLAAGIFYLSSPLGFSLSRVNLTDGPLTFFFAATLFAARAALLRRESGRPAAGLAALAGIAAAGAFLTKGLVGIVLPGGILLAWCLATRRLRSLGSLLLSPAIPLFLLAAAPWFFLTERRNPGFLRFFFIHEHLQRFATPAAHREGPIYYFVLIFLGGFLPALPFFFSGLRGLRGAARGLAGEPDTLFFFLWFCVVFLFFSLSSSKLAPYLLPLFPAAAALAARGISDGTPAPRRWRLCAGLATLLVLSLVFYPTARQWIRDYGLLMIVLCGAVILLVGTWTAASLWRRGASFALAVFAAGWAGFYLSLAVAWPRVPTATALHDLSQAAKTAAERYRAQVVCYRTYIQGLPWELKHPVPVSEYVGELESQFVRSAAIRDALFWSRQKFWSEWGSGQRIMAVVPEGEIGEFSKAGVPGKILLRGARHCLVANFPIEPR